MSKILTLFARSRTDQGTGAARRLRRSGGVPAIVDGGQEAPQMLTLDHHALELLMNNSGFLSQILELVVDDGKPVKVIVKHVEKHPIKKQFLHFDLLRVSAKALMVIAVPIQCMGVSECVAIQDEDGVLNLAIPTVEIRCLPHDVPGHIEVDISGLGMDETVHLSALKLPEKVELAVKVDETHDPMVVAIHLPKVIVEEEVVEAEAATATADEASGTAADASD